MRWSTGAVGEQWKWELGRTKVEMLNSLAGRNPQTRNLQRGSLSEICGNAGKPIRLETSTRLLFSALRSRTCRRWLLYVLRQEFRTFLSRTRYALGSQVYEGAVAGPAFEELGAGSWIACQRTQARIEDTQQIPQVWRRWEVSPLDSEIFLLGWTAGERWASQRDHKDSETRSAD